MCGAGDTASRRQGGATILRASADTLPQIASARLAAVRVVAFCPVPDTVAKTKPVERYDVPAPSEGYDKSRDEILRHVRDLIDQLAATPAAK